MDLTELEKEITFKASRSGGAGGQNVNKVATKVEGDFDIRTSQLFTDEEKERLLQKLATRINSSGILKVVSQSERTQLRNKRLVLLKFEELIEQGLKIPQVRKKKQLSKAQKEQRLLAKKRRSEVKKLRQKDY